MRACTLSHAAVARAREGALVLPLWWTDDQGVCRCPKGVDCPSPGKHPLTSHGLDDATSDPGTIERWWHQWPEANIGVRTDNTPRIDIDLTDVAAELAKDTALPLTTEVVRTPRGGLHIAAASSTPVQSRTLHLQGGRKLGELKGARAYVVVPPSRIGGRPYVRLSPEEITPMQVDDPVAWLAGLLPASRFTLAFEQPDVRRDYEALASTVHEGQGRHLALTSYGGRIWIDGMAPAAFVGALRAVNEVQCRPPLPGDELRAIAEHFIARREPSALAATDHHDPAIVSASGLPQVVVSNRQMREIVDDAWEVLLRHNDPPRFFQHAGATAEVRADEDGRPQIVHLGLPGLKGRVDRCANWLRLTDDGPRPARPPRDVVEDMLAIPRALPVLRGITGTPSFASDGSLIVAPGYQATTQLYYHPVGEPVPAIPQRPDATDLKRARQVIGQEWLADFPFLDDSSRAHAIAVPITAVAREMINGPTPLFAVDAPTAGTGKGLLAAGIGVIVTGRPPPVTTETRSDEELRKRITALLCTGVPLVLFDNIKHRLDSGTLAALLTAPTWSDRLLGKNQTVELLIRTVWLATGNNLQLGNEIVRRTVWIRLDAKVDRPWERANFRHADLIAWLRRHRHELVWACLVLVQNWIAQGRREWDGRLLGSYEAWSSLVGGVLQAAGVHGFLANREELYARADAETQEWRAFVEVWWKRFGHQPMKTSELFGLVVETDLLPSVFALAKDNASERSLKTRFGAALAKSRDRRFGPYFIRHLGTDPHSKGALYRLEQASDAAEPRRSEDRGSALPAVWSSNECRPRERAVWMVPEAMSESLARGRAVDIAGAAATPGGGAASRARCQIRVGGYQK